MKTLPNTLHCKKEVMKFLLPFSLEIIFHEETENRTDNQSLDSRLAGILNNRQIQYSGIGIFHSISGQTKKIGTINLFL